MKVRPVHVLPNIPEPLRPLRDLAMNLWFSWNWEAVALFIRLNAVLWEKSYQNPVLMLGSLPQEELEAAARDESFVANLRDVYESFKRYMGAPKWFRDAHGAEKDVLVAYFSTEFGIDEGLPIYSGGLGVLSGDHLKATSDLGVPLVGVGLLYQKGYFRQILNLDGWQRELYADNDWFNMPVTMERDPGGSPLTIEVEMGTEKVAARIWRVQIGMTPLYLLDSNVEANSHRGREITGVLYGGDRDMRIRQEIMLGIGGVRALRALGLAPTVYHMNEGHSAFLAVERIRALMEERGLAFAEAREHVFASNVFTTHTPVPAGNEVFDPELVRRYLQPMTQRMGLAWDEFLSLGQGPFEDLKSFGLTVLALRMAGAANAVSRLHAETSRKMWKGLWPGLPEPEVPITSITNGAHTYSWVSHEMKDLYVRYMGPRFVEKPADPTVWDRVRAIPANELWRVHESRRERLVFFARKRLKAQLTRQGAGTAAIRAAEEALNADALTIGFSRRFATYKRATLLFRDPERLIRMLTSRERPVQIIFAGKAHPQDQPAKELIKSVVHFANDPRLRYSLVFLEDYDINVGRYLFQGADVWLNTPRRPLEASGTSGMKAAMNGGLNVSILDGWWAEGCSPDVGWAIGAGETYSDPAEQDQVECELLFNLFEQEIIPLFYERDRTGIPQEWVRVMKDSIRKLGALFNTHRMLREYVERAYLPAHRAGRLLAEGDFAAAKALAAWRGRIAAEWPRVSIRVMDERRDGEVRVGGKMEAVIRAELGDLSPEEVAVEVYHGPLGYAGEIRDGKIVRATPAGRDGGAFLFRAAIPFGASGRYGYAARIVPRHGHLVNPFTPLVLTWE
jgi:glycogen phosphorylase